MATGLFVGRERIAARALFLAQRLNLRKFEGPGCLAPSPLTVEAGRGGCAVLFRYGAVVLFGLEPAEEAEFLAALRPLLSGPFPEPESEEIEILLDPEGEERVAGGVLRLRSPGVDRLQITADALARSTVLAHHEAGVAGVFDEMEPLALGLREKGRVRMRGRALLRQIGRALAVQHQVVGRVEVEEKPEALWEEPDLERLWMRLAEEYELRERHAALEQKLELIARTATTLLTLLYNRRSLRVEWYIVALILLEILIYLYDLFARR